MGWLNKMMDAIDYMEMNVEKKIDIEDVARVACSSTFHFQRMFHMLTGFTVSEYIRNRRLTLAAQELAILSKIRVIDVALKYGYDSPESFTKAFRRAHGITPTAAREPGVNLKAFPRISFHLSLRGDKDMDYRIINKNAFKVIGEVIKISTCGEQHHQRISEFWGECLANGTCEKLSSLGNTQTMLSVSMDCQEDMDQMSYMIGIEDINNIEGTEFSKIEIPASTWAIFTSLGSLPFAIQDTLARIFQEWFPATSYEHANAPVLEICPPGDTNAADYKCEIWIPIVKK